VNLFSEVQGFFEQKYSGRYIARLMQAVCHQDPRPFYDFFHAKFPGRLRASVYRRGGLRLEDKYSFYQGDRKRWADLALYLDGAPVALVELKFDDSFHELQLEDYLRVCKKAGLAFLVITRAPLTAEEIALLKKYGQRRAHYMDLVQYLRASRHPATQMLYDYFKEEGLIMEAIDSRSLYVFVHRLLKPWGGSGHIHSADGMTEGPKQFSSLLANMRLLASEIAPRVRRPRMAKRERSPTVEFEVWPKLDVKKTTSQLADWSGNVPPAWRKGGSVYVYAQTPIWLTGTWIYVYYGFRLSVWTDKQGLKVRLYAGISGPGLKRAGIEEEDRTLEEPIPRKMIEDPDIRPEVEEALLRLVARLAKKLLKDKRLPSVKIRKELKRIATAN